VPPQTTFPTALIKLLLGMLVLGMAACAAFVVLLCLAVAWILSTGSQIDTLHAIGEDTVSALHVRDATDDSGVRAMMHATTKTLITAAQAAEDPETSLPVGPLSGLASWPMWWMTGWYLPYELTLVTDPAPTTTSGLTTGGAANFRHLVRVVRIQFEYAAQYASSSAQPLEEEGRLFIPMTGSGGYLSFDEGTVFWGELEQLRQLRARTDAETQPVLARDIQELRTSWIAVAVTRETRGLDHILNLKDMAQERAPTSDVLPVEQIEFERAWVGARLLDANTAELRVAIEGVSPEGVDMLTQLLESHCDQQKAAPPLSGMGVHCTTEVRGEDIVLNASWTHIQAAMATQIEAGLREQERREGPSEADNNP